MNSLMPISILKLCVNVIHFTVGYALSWFLLHTYAMVD